MNKARRSLLMVLAATALVAGASNSVSAAPMAAPAAPGVASYLESLGIAPATAVYQTGARNYAGPDCPGAGWNCTDTSRPVVQQSSAQASGQNVFVCEPAGPGTDPGTNTCVIVQVNVTGDNHAMCLERDGEPGASQSCSIEQSNTLGDNVLEIEQRIDQDEGATQEATQEADASQSNVQGDNVATIEQRIVQRSKVHSTGAITQVQEANQTADLSQMNGSGDNDADVDQSQEQDADAHGQGGFVEQFQNDASEGRDVLATIDQVTNGGANDAKLDQTINQRGKAETKGAVDQFQGSFDGGLEGQIDQDGPNPSRIDADQKELQRLDAHTKGPVTQDQQGPHACCSTQFSNPDNVFDIDQLGIQRSNRHAEQTKFAQGDCDTSGNCTVDQTVIQDGERTDNSCEGQSCHIFIECFPEGEGDFSTAQSTCFVGEGGVD